MRPERDAGVTCAQVDSLPCAPVDVLAGQPRPIGVGARRAGRRRAGDGDRMRRLWAGERAQDHLGGTGVAAVTSRILRCRFPEECDRCLLGVRSAELAPPRRRTSSRSRRYRWEARAGGGGGWMRAPHRRPGRGAPGPVPVHGGRERRAWGARCVAPAGALKGAFTDTGSRPSPAHSAVSRAAVAAPTARPLALAAVRSRASVASSRASTSPAAAGIGRGVSGRRPVDRARAHQDAETRNRCARSGPSPRREPARPR
jgi:hypothetical protein